MTAEDIAPMVEAFDFEVMEEHRARIEELVADPATPRCSSRTTGTGASGRCFHDEYLLAFNNPNVTLVDCPGGVDAASPSTASIADGTEYELDCIVLRHRLRGRGHAVPAPRRPHDHRPRRRHDRREVEGRCRHPARHDDRTGSRTCSSCRRPASRRSSRENFTHLMVAAPNTSPRPSPLLEEQGVKAFDVTEEAEADWVGQILAANAKAAAAAPPVACRARRGHECSSTTTATWSSSNRTPAATAAASATTSATAISSAEWRESGDFAGLELHT